MKKIIALCLAFSLCVVFSGCTDGNDKNESDINSSSSEGSKKDLNQTDTKSEQNSSPSVTNAEVSESDNKNANISENSSSEWNVTSETGAQGSRSAGSESVDKDIKSLEISSSDTTNSSNKYETDDIKIENADESGEDTEINKDSEVVTFNSDDEIIILPEIELEDLQ